MHERHRVRFRCAVPSVLAIGVVALAGCGTPDVASPSPPPSAAMTSASATGSDVAPESTPDSRPASVTSAPAGCVEDMDRVDGLLSVQDVFGAGVPGERSASARRVDAAQCGPAPGAGPVGPPLCESASALWAAERSGPALALAGVATARTAMFRRGGVPQVRQVRYEALPEGAMGLTLATAQALKACHARESDGLNGKVYVIGEPVTTAVRMSEGRVDAITALTPDAPDPQRLLDRVPSPLMRR